MSNPIRGLKQAAIRSGAALKGLEQRIKGKGGRVRGNLTGKRVDFSSRTVVSPDPNLDIDQVGVPMRIATILTIEERVTPFNMAILQERVYVGAKHIRGAHTVICKAPPPPLGNGSTKTIYLQFVKPESRQNIKLECGWIVERYLQDNDRVIFNRQPSLHKKSLMAHRVKIMPVGDTFRLNLAAVVPYNADFDGDEMNMHAMNSIEGRAELQELMAIDKQVLNAQTNKPTFGLVQDALTGSYLMTRKNTFLTREQVMDLMMAAEQTMLAENPQWRLPVPAILKPQSLWTGKQVYSMLFPPFSMSKVVRNGTEFAPLDDMERTVVIQRGDLLCGALCKQTVGIVTSGVVHVMAKDMSMERTCMFLSDAQRMVNRFMLYRGFSVGISDCLPNPEIDNGVRAIIDHAYKRIARINESLEQDDSSAASQSATQGQGQLSKRDIEEPVANILRDVINQTGRLAQLQMSDRNRIYVMNVAGSKGNPVNLSQIMACVGQQTVDGRRIHVRNSLNKVTQMSTRTLTNYAPGDEHPETHGFCPNSYAIGLEPEEMYMHAMGGREGLVDTAVKTSVTGYTQRRLLKAMEALRVHFDGTVRNAEGYIVDFLYGGDGMDAQFLEPCALNLVKMSDADLCKAYSLESYPNNLDPAWQTVVATELRELILLRDECRRYKRNIWSGEMDATVLLPAHIPRLVQSIWDDSVANPTMRNSAALTPTQCHDGVAALLDRLAKRFPNGAGMIFLAATIRSYLAASQLCAIRPHTSTRRWTRAMFKDLLERIERLVLKSVADAGEMVGALASESIGEPSTQLTLNTFHYSGVGNKNVSMGVPRLRELIDVTRGAKMRTPSLTIALQPQYATNADAVSYFAQTLIQTSLESLIQNAATIWEPDPLCTTVPEDTAMVQMANIFRNHASLRTASRWVIRWTLNRELALKRGLTPVEVANTIREHVCDRGDVVYSPMNTDHWVIRLTLFDIREMALEYSDDVDQQRMQERVLTQTEMNRLMATITLGGIAGIQDASTREVVTTVINPMTHALERLKEWIIDTRGTALQEVWALDGVDWARTISNDLYEIYDTLGVEAAAQVLFQEIKTVLSDSYVNDRHIMAVVKTMCFRGYLMPMSRHGINRVDTGVLMRVSFEESMEQLINAAMFNETDYLQGVTETMMVGVRAPMGTGSVTVFTDPQYQETMRKIAYGRPRQVVNKQRILRSAITQWDTHHVMKSDDLDQLDRPPSPPASPLWIHHSTNTSTPGFGGGGGEPEDIYLPPPLEASVSNKRGYGFLHSTDTANDGNEESSHKRRKYCPSSPDISGPPPLLPTSNRSILLHPFPLSLVAMEMTSTVPPPATSYRPSSPDLTVDYHAHTDPLLFQPITPIASQTASFIPLTNGPLLMPPPSFFFTNATPNAAPVLEAPPTTVRSKLLAPLPVSTPMQIDEVATEFHQSVPLLPHNITTTTKDTPKKDQEEQSAQPTPENISAMIASLAAYVQSKPCCDN
jgi:DNA-directed RNA polymerase II subunit RPB1